MIRWYIIHQDRTWYFFRFIRFLPINQSKICTHIMAKLSESSFLGSSNFWIKSIIVALKKQKSGPSQIVFGRIINRLNGDSGQSGKNNPRHFVLKPAKICRLHSWDRAKIYNFTHDLEIGQNPENSKVAPHK